MRKNKTKQRLMAMMLSVIMVVGMMPVSALAETGTFLMGTSGEIIAFEPLGSDITMQSVPLGTSERDLELPDTLTAAIRLAALEEEPMLDSGKADSELDSSGTVTGSAIGINEMDDSAAGEEAKAASPSDAKEAENSFEVEPTEKTVDSVDEITVPLPVTWASSPEYDGEAAGTYVFTPELPEGLAPEDGVEVPTIIVEVEATASTGTVTAFDELPEDIRWQNTAAPEFLEIIGGAVEGEAVQIPVTWEADHDYDAEYPQWGLYVFTAVLGEGYGLEDGVVLPRMTVYIPQAVGKRMARMAGGGTEESPLEITTAAQLSEIAALVNTRAKGLERFLFNDPNARVSLKLMNDIDLSAYTKDGGWTPIGTSECLFGGEFDGNGHKISNLIINRANGEYQGLFGYIGDGSLVKNLGVENANVSAKGYVGGVTGYISGGMIQNCYSISSIDGEMYVGGLVGCVSNDSTVQNCYAISNIMGYPVSAHTGSYMIGGLAGAFYDSTVKNCYVTGRVVGSEGSPSSVYTGGVAGYFAGEGTIQNCAALNHAVVGAHSVGRVIGNSPVEFPAGNSFLSRNIAFSGMNVMQNGSAKAPAEGEDQVDGQSKTADEIKTANLFESLFGNDTAWTYAQGNLPGFGVAIKMPEYLVDGSDPNFRGTGTSENPYQITNPAQLAKLAELTNLGNTDYNNKHYRLMNDLDLFGYAADEGWTPIGTYSYRFEGTFDGNGNKITNLTINRDTIQYQGLFGFIGSGGVVKNLGVTGVSISSDTMVGGVAGFIETAIVQNCYSTGNVTASGFVGGVVGYADKNSMVEYCYSTCDVNSIGTSLDQCVGGVVGLIRIGSKMQSCYSTGNVSRTGTSPSGFAGGVAGRVVRGSIQDCYSTGNVSGSEITGGVVGYLEGYTGDDISYTAIRNCYSTGTISNSTKAGGVAGQVYYATVENCAALNPSVSGLSRTSVAKRVLTLYSDGILSGNLAFDGMVVLINDNPQDITSDANDVDGLSKTAFQIAASDFWTQATGFSENWNIDLWSIETGKLPILKNMGGQHASIPGHLLPAGANFFEGAGTSVSDPYLIKTAIDLARLAELVNAGISPYANENVYYKLVNDIDLSPYGEDFDGGQGWTPIGNSVNSFKGEFDGNNKSITGLFINRDTADRIGLFGYLFIDSKVQSLSIMGTSIRGNNYVGGVAGDIWGATVENCAASGSISGSEYVGGVVGAASSGTVQSCYSTGGVIGTGDYVGGVAGYLEYDTTAVQRCYSIANVTGSNYVGGVAGDVGAGSVQNCYSAANVTGGKYIGGVAGSVGSAGKGSVQNCYSSGNVLGTNENSYIGGVLGFLGGTVKNCVALNPSIKVGTYNFGRVAGDFSSGTLSNNYAFSRIPGTWENKGPGAKDGVDVSSQTLFGGNFWTMAENWDANPWDSGIWTFEDSKMPALTGLAGQSGDGGLYLTARDIQYATVSTGPFTYNGSEQIPTITFDDETLMKDTDYTISITSMDGSGTSAGTNAGTVTLTITGIGSFYGTKNLTYTIDKKEVTVTPAEGQSKKYGATDPVLTYTTSPTLYGSDVFTGTLSRVAGEGVGTYAIFLGDLGAGGNYEVSLASAMVNFTIEQAKVQSITTIVDNVNKTAYEIRSATTAQAVVDSAGLPSSLSVTTGGGTATLPVTWETSTAYNAKGTVYAVTGTLTGDSNIAHNDITKSVTVTVTPVTALNPVFDDTLVVISSDSSATAAELGSTILPTSGGITIEGENVAYTINWNGGETLDRTAMGNEQTFTGTISYASLPAWLTLPSDFTVSRKVMVTAKTPITIGGITTANKTYDGAAYAPTGTVTCSHGFPINQLKWLYESTDGIGYSSSTAPPNAGAYKLTISVPDSNANYTGSEVFTFTIEKRQITLTADNKTVVKGASLPQLTYTVSNLPIGKTKADALSIEPVLACPTFDGNTPGSYAINLTDGTATDNYTITTRMNGTLTIAEQTYIVTFSLNGGSRTGDGELTQVVALGNAATAPTVTRSNYTFIGWDKDFTNVTSDLIIMAKWQYNGSGSSDSGSSGGFSSGGSPTTPVTTLPEKQPGQPVTVTIPITVTAGANGVANTAIPDKAITDAITKAQADAKEQGKTANGISVELNITMPKDATSLTVTLTQSSLDSLVNAGVKSLKINGYSATISFDEKALAEIRKQSIGNVTITIKPAQNLIAAAKEFIGSRPVYDITVSYVKNGKALVISAFNGGIATISIPYKPGKNEATGYLYGVYVDAEGNATRINDSAYDTNEGAILISTDHLSVYGVGYTKPSAKFTDIGTHWGKEPIDYVVGRGLLSGTSEKTFAPDTAMTREMLVTALGRLAGVDTKVYTTNNFTDVKADSVFRPYIEWAYKKGIVQGIGNQKFAPDRAITREEIAVIFVSYAKANDYKLPVTREATTYADASSIGSVYKTAVTAVQQAGIMMGGTNNKFNPKASATRAEISSMLHRYIKLTIEPDTAQGWSNNDAGQWLYYKDGKVLIGAQIIDGVKYFFNTDGTLKTGWVKEVDNWRYYSGNKATVDWLDISDKRYYFTEDGLMVSGKWLQIDSKWYYFYADGSLPRSTKVDGYEVDESGARKSK